MIATIVATFGAFIIVYTLTRACIHHFDMRPRKEIIRLLDRHGELYGLDLVKLSEKFGGSLRRGSIYVHLHALEERGIVSSRVGPVESIESIDETVLRLPRRLYKLRDLATEARDLAPEG